MHAVADPFAHHRFDCASGASGAALPISRRMFFGHAAAECAEGEDTILRLMSQREANARTMRAFLEGVERGSPRALLDCMPDNTDAHTRHGLMQGTGLRTVDCKAWAPEVPESIGIYHAYLRGYNRDVRAHKLFIVCR